jgi:protein translocase SecG subunit
MIRHILIILTCIVSILLIGIIFFQSPRQESLSNAFNGEKVYVSSLNKTLIRMTYLLTLILVLLLVTLKLI